MSEKAMKKIKLVASALLVLVVVALVVFAEVKSENLGLYKVLMLLSAGLLLLPVTILPEIYNGGNPNPFIDPELREVIFWLGLLLVVLVRLCWVIATI